MDRRIVKFIKKHHVMTLATASGNIPWTAHCFYAFMEEEKALVFTTDDDTRHGREMIENQQVAAGIVLETKIIGMIRGAQLTGKVTKVIPLPGFREGPGVGNDFPLPGFREGPGVGNDRPGLGNARAAYLKRFPFAALLKTNLWVLEIETIKFTDNRLGFGTKLKWQRGNE